MATSECRGTPRVLCISCARDRTLVYKLFSCEKRQAWKGIACKIVFRWDIPLWFERNVRYMTKTSRSCLYQVIWHMHHTLGSSKFLIQSVHVPTVSKFYLIQDSLTDWLTDWPWFDTRLEFHWLVCWSLPLSANSFASDLVSILAV